MINQKLSQHFFVAMRDTNVKYAAKKGMKITFLKWTSVWSTRALVCAESKIYNGSSALCWANARNFQDASQKMPNGI